MPHCTGLEILDDIRTIQPDLPVIVVTASPRLEDAALSALKGAFDYLIKPTDRDVLLTSIRRALNERKTRPDSISANDILLSDQFTRRKKPDCFWLLETSGKEYREIYDRLPVPYFILGADSFLLRYANQAFLAFFGMGDVDAPFFSFIDKSDRFGLEAELRVCKNISGRIVSGHTYCGDRFSIVVSFRTSETEGYIEGSFIDITAKKALEEESAFSRKMEALGRLAEGVAHDFSNILHLIYGYAGLLNDDQDLPIKSRNFIYEIKRAARKGIDIVLKLLSVAKNKRTSPVFIDMHEVVRDIEPMLQSMLGSSIILECRLNAAFPIVKADPGQMEQVLSNLIMNAKDAMPEEGNVRICTSSLAGASNAIDGFMLEVSDSGRGIRVENREKIFEPFFSTKEDGMGMGLAGVYAIVTGCGGRIEVDGESSAGSTFRLFFPRVIIERE